jgi:hypothetical protein
MNELRRIFDFIMGCCAGFLYFYGDFLGYAVGTLMLVSFLVMTYRDRMLKFLDKSIEKYEQEEKEEETE